MKCTSSCMSPLKAPYQQYFKPCVRQDWSKKPGFLDPCVVTDVCISVIERFIYSCPKTLREEKATFDEPCGRYLKNRDICVGLKMYLETWEEQYGIEEAVQEYIDCPSKEKIEDAIDTRPQRALAFLLAYFKNRGPFLTWIYRGKQVGAVTARFLSNAFLARLRMLQEMDMYAAIAIGCYLNKLTRIAADYKLIDFHKNLATIWGPVYIKVEPVIGGQPPVYMTECEQYCAAIEMFAKVLDAVPWGSVASMKKSFSTSSMPVPKMSCVYATTNEIREVCLMETLNRPSSCKGSLADLHRKEVQSHCVHPDNQTSKEEQFDMPKCRRSKLPPKRGC